MKTSRSERGAAAVLIAGSMILLLGFAALALDSGSAWSTRRQLQGAVDAGTLSAGLATRFDQVQTGCAASGSLSATSACNGAIVAFDIINASADTPFALNQFADATRCTDSVFGADYAGGVTPTVTSPSLTLHCIRFTSNFDKIKILLPIDDVPTTFGRLLGRNSIGVSALAEAELTYQRPGTVIPFVIGPTGAGESHACLLEPSNGNAVPPCGGPDDGNFGYMGPQLYGDDALNTPTICSNASNADRIAASFAKGADHYYAKTTDVAGTANDQAECPNKNQPIDNVDVQTGGSTGALTTGAFGEIYGTEGRLLCKDGDPEEPAWFGFVSQNSDTGGAITNDCYNVSSNRLPETLDNTPIWEHMRTFDGTEDPGGLTNADELCALVPSVRTTQAIEDCLTEWRADPPLGPDAGDPADDPRLFTDDLAKSPRFAWVPLLASDPSSGGSGTYDITEFVPIYIHRLAWKCTGGSCDVTFAPGEVCSGCPFTQNKSLDGMTAFVLTRALLPPSLANFPDADGQLTYNLSE